MHHDHDFIIKFFFFDLILWSGEEILSSDETAALYHAHFYLHFWKFPKS